MFMEYSANHVQNNLKPTCNTSWLYLFISGFDFMFMIWLKIELLVENRITLHDLVSSIISCIMCKNAVICLSLMFALYCFHD